MGVAERAGSRGPAERGCERPRVTQWCRAHGLSGLNVLAETPERAGSRGPAERGCERPRVTLGCRLRALCGEGV